MGYRMWVWMPDHWRCGGGEEMTLVMVPCHGVNSLMVRVLRM